MLKDEMLPCNCTRMFLIRAVMQYSVEVLVKAIMKERKSDTVTGKTESKPDGLHRQPKGQLKIIIINKRV